MATTQSNLGKVHVFPSETLYNNNKTNVAANDLAFVVDNSSGIVAQSLGTNGYVKFANGLIIQWGKYTGYANNEQTITYPVAFSSAVYYIYHSIGGTTNTLGYTGKPVSVTLTNAKMSFGNWSSYNPSDCTHWWVAIGK